MTSKDIPEFSKCLLTSKSLNVLSYVMQARNGNVFFWEFPTGKAYTYQRSVTWSKKKKQELVLLDNWSLFLLEQPYYLDKAIKVMVVNNLEWLRGSSVSDSVMFCRKLKSFVSIYAMVPREV